jgi:hypothetical protein
MRVHVEAVYVFPLNSVSLYQCLTVIRAEDDTSLRVLDLQGYQLGKRLSDSETDGDTELSTGSMSPL